ncbi:MAG: chemotaxis protein CheD [Piscinibacter sp.]|uniref:chemotaxis protein CheD n=1 Tax=Piscinibacter sp. TaxID=1903157 RepID=UPI00258D2556|nr:chemotaxis protein CheD [Piscinibacter sp.]MCW5667600.1 chemotaxis protein CheD [Piscinibacter sp.]
MSAAAGHSGAAPQVLHPGDVACGLRGDRFETLLGSCVAVVMTDPRRTVGALCHIVHSLRAPAARTGDTAYAEPALAALFAQLRRHGLQPARCEAWVYGGGNMFPDLYPGVAIGERNVEQVLQRLQAAGVQVLQHDVGGPAYRRLRWTVGPLPPEVTSVELIQ